MASGTYEDSQLSRQGLAGNLFERGFVKCPAPVAKTARFELVNPVKTVTGCFVRRILRLHSRLRIRSFLRCRIYVISLINFWKGVVMVDWGSAFQVFIFGFGGVFVSLVLLTIAIQLSGKIVHTFLGKKQ